MKSIESNLTRLLNYMTNHNTGVITAFRSEYSYRENLQRNRSLLSKLFYSRYSVTAVRGVYIENFATNDAKEISATIFFVTDIKHKKTLEKDLRKLGEEFEPDSILFIPSPGNRAYLWGTNQSQYPGYGKVKKFSQLNINSFDEFMTKIQGSPFIFESIKEHIPTPTGFFGRWSVSHYAKQNWRDMEDIE
ncbi:hypothetical protein KA977_06690 [Candidatus Dependentiae bacterium]|nr:hypothetical protein [Candidatus Dependentiae bacterium]